MRVGRLIFAAVAACCVSGLAAQAQVQKQIQISPDILTKRPALTPELKLEVFDVPDLAITHLSGPTAGPDEAGHVELTIDLKNFGESQSIRRKRIRSVPRSVRRCNSNVSPSTASTSRTSALTQRAPGVLQRFSGSGASVLDPHAEKSKATKTVNTETAVGPSRY